MYLLFVNGLPNLILGGIDTTFVLSRIIPWAFFKRRQSNNRNLLAATFRNSTIMIKAGGLEGISKNKGNGMKGKGNGRKKYFCINYNFELKSLSCILAFATQVIYLLETVDSYFQGI